MGKSSQALQRVEVREKVRAAEDEQEENPTASWPWKRVRTASQQEV